MTKPIDLQPIRDRLAAATPGPWTYIGQGLIVHPGSRYDGAGVPTVETRIPQCDADAELMARAPGIMAELCNEVDRLRESLNAITVATEHATDQFKEIRETLEGDSDE